MSDTRSADMTTLYAHSFTTPLGEMVAVVNGDGALLRLDFVGQESVQALAEKAATPGQTVEWQAEPCQPVVRQVEEYFAGSRRAFDLVLAPRGTVFQQAVWQALQRIPYGSTTNYRALAESLGKPGGSRAVGRANATNPIAIVVPCHRVIGANGSLTGYAGGLPIKARLLTLEGATLPLPLQMEDF
jgi:methylated-DNA-[protein]-cysteine S-methyltransferase